MIDTNDTDAMVFFEDLKKEDAAYAKLAQKLGPLAEFITEYEYRKGSSGLTQSEIARRMGTRQSAISRFESMKHPPSYDFLQALSHAVGDRLFLSPSAAYSLTLPYDLRDAAEQAASRRGIGVPELMAQLLRESLQRENLELRGAGTITVRMPALVSDHAAESVKPLPPAKVPQDCSDDGLEWAV